MEKTSLKSIKLLLLTLFFCLLNINLAHSESLSTTFAGGNGSNGNMFDVSATGSQSINITGFAQNFSISGLSSGFELWARAGGVQGVTNNTGWVLIGSTGSFTTNPSGTPTNIPFNSPLAISIASGKTLGLYLTDSGGVGVSYTNGNAVGDVAASDGNLTIYEGYGKGYPFANTFQPRVWNGIIFYSLGSLIQLADTQASIQQSARNLRSIFNLASISSNFSNMNTYDCNLFDDKGACVSLGGRYTTVDSPNLSSANAVFVAGYKATPHIRIGGFVDQSLNVSEPNGIKLSNKIPLLGAFAVWNQQVDGLGYQVKLANAYQEKGVDISRQVIGTSEAGRGKTDLSTESYVAELSYALAYQDKTLLRPYAALRYTRIKQDGFTESGVTAPLTYASLQDRSTTALLGIKVNHQITPKTALTASLGVEQDLSHSVDDYSATSSSIAGLASENFNGNIKRTRPVASAGAYYALNKNQRISGDIYYQQLAFQSTGSTSAYVNYMIGF